MDFLSAVTLGMVKGCDCLVLNAVANVEKAMKHLDGYGTVSYTHLSSKKAEDEMEDSEVSFSEDMQGVSFSEMQETLRELKKK